MPNKFYRPYAIALLFSLGLPAILLTAWLAWFDGDTVLLPPDVQLPDGSIYFGEIQDGRFHGQGKLLWSNGARYEGGFSNGLAQGHGVMEFADGARYEGDFKNGQLHGQGVLTYMNGTRYSGEFRNGMPHGLVTISYADGSEYTGNVVKSELQGQGRLTESSGVVYEGEFVDGEIVKGSSSNPDGSHYQGGFSAWHFQGEGEFTDVDGNVYRGHFENGVLNGEGTVVSAAGTSYSGELENWRYAGDGVLTDAEGNIYTGEFAYGMYHGDGELVYAEPVDGVESLSGQWEYGRIAEEPDPEAEKRRRQKLENTLYAQERRLADAEQQLLATRPDDIDLYFLGIAGDGTQDVFIKEIRFIRDLFDENFGTNQRSLALSNHMDTWASLPLATKTNLDASLKTLAAKMDAEDILFLYMTSHGSQDHHFSINMPGVDLPSIQAQELAQSLEDSGIKWKVVVVSACYSGGFIPPLEDDNTLIMTAARDDRRSFGCGDDSDMTYFGRAYFEQALLQAESFADAFQQARNIIHERENQEQPDSDHSEPQISMGKNIEAYLQAWWPRAPHSGELVAN